jgi:hypothetical protein
LGVGAFVGLLTTAPVWIVVARNFDVIAADLADPAERTSDTLISPQALDYAVVNTIGARFYPLAAPEAAPGEPPRSDDIRPLLWTEAAWLALGLAGLGAYAYRNRASPTGQMAGVLVAWTLAPVAAFTAQWTAVYHQYFMPLMPAPYLVIGAASGLAARRLSAWRPWPAVLAGGLALAIAAAQLAAYGRVLDFFARHFTPGDLGTPLGLKMEAARRAQDLALAHSAGEILVVGEGDRDWGHETAAVFDVLLDRTPHRFVTGGQAAVLPQGSAVILVAPGQWPATAWYRKAAGRGERMQLREGELPYRLFHTAGGFDLPPDFQPPASDDRLSNGVQILGHYWETPLTATAPGRLLVAWQVGPAPDTSSDYHFTLYLQDAAGQVWAQNDGPSYSSDMWRPGDVVVNWLPLHPPAEVPPEPVFLRLGMYTYPGIVRVPVVGPDGAALSDAVQLASMTLQP